MTNIQAFNILSLGILNHLYDCFPEKIELNTSNIVEKIFPKNISYDDAFNTTMSLVPETIDFLQEEGLITCCQKNHGNFSNVRLTMKGLAVLNLIPESLKEKPSKISLIERIKDLLSKTIDSSTEKACEEIIGIVFRMMLVNWGHK